MRFFEDEGSHGQIAWPVVLRGTTSLAAFGGSHFLQTREKSKLPEPHAL